MSNDKILQINRRSFITVCIILVSVMLIAYIATFFVQPGIYVDGVYQEVAKEAYPFWRFLIAPLEVFLSEDAIIVIVISLFIVILGGAFHVIDQTNGIKSILQYMIKRFKDKRMVLLYSITLFFMLFGALFGIFEESITMLPIIVLLSLSMGWDTFTGLGMCLMAAGFGFSSAITNPFSIGLGSTAMGISLVDGILYRIVIFVIMYLLLIGYLTLHVRKIEKDPTKSPSYESDLEKRNNIILTDVATGDAAKTRKVYTWFFILLLLIIITTAIVSATQPYTIPIIALTFLFGAFVCGKILGYRLKTIGAHFISGMIAMSPAIIMIMLAASAKLILVNGNIMATMIHSLTTMLGGMSPIVGILFIYAIILLIQFFIGSASAKVILIIPIIQVLADNIGITRNIALLAFVFGDGYTDLVYPTNPVLLIALGMVSFSYVKWIKKTFLLQLLILALTVLFLLIGYYIGY